MGAYGSSHAPRVNLGGTRVCWSICDLQKRNDIHRHTAGSRGFCWLLCFGRTPAEALPVCMILVNGYLDFI